MKNHPALRSAVLLALMLFASSSALAQVAAPPPGAPAGPVSTNAVTKAMQDDASNDRGLVFPHAGTIGGGTWSLNSYELFLLGFTYGIDDATQISATTLLPLFEGMPLVLALQGKRHLFRSGRTLVSAMANLNLVQISDSSIDNNGNVVSASVFAGSFGGSIAVDHYTTDQGDLGLHGSFSLNGVFAGGDSSTGISVFEVGSGAGSALVGGISYRIASSAKLLGEVAWPMAVTSKGVTAAEFLFAAYGIRFHGRTLAVDLSFIRPFGSEFQDTGLILGVPWVAFSYRPQ